MRLLWKDVDGHTQRFMPKKDEKKAARIFIVYTVKVFKQGGGKENNDRRKDEQDIKYKNRWKEAKPDSKATPSQPSPISPQKPSSDQPQKPLSSITPAFPHRPTPGVRYQFSLGSPKHSPTVTPFQPFALMAL